jgi:hypothetical protein
MRISVHSLIIVILVTVFAATCVVAQEQLAQSPRILTAKTIYFDNQTGSDVVGKQALIQLKNWAKFRIVQDWKQADLVLVLSAQPYRGGNIILSGGQTASIGSSGQIAEDKIPNYNKQSPTRYAYLTVIDPKTEENLWSAAHLWGGLLTGFNSVGARLVKELEKQCEKQP